MGLGPHRSERRNLAELVDDYLLSLEDRRLSKGHRRTVKGHLEGLIESSAAYSLEDLHDESILAWLRLATSARVWNHRRASVRAFLAWCKAPIPDLPRQNEATDRRYERSPLSLAELRALLTGDAPLYRRVAYGLAATAGLRRSEIAGLTWGDIDLEAGTVRVRASIAKDSQDATLPIHNLVLGLLAEWQETWEEESARIGGMASWRKKRAASGQALVCPAPRVPTLHRDLLVAGVGQPDRPLDRERGLSAQTFGLIRPTGERLDFHALRGTCATLALAAGAAPGVVQKLLRHSDFKMTDKHYARLGIADKRGAQGAIDIPPANRLRPD